MGKEKYQKRVMDLFAKSPVVSFHSISRITKNRGYAKQLIRNLILRNRIKKLAKGFYTTRDDPSVSVFCFQPSYLGLQDALSIHNLWEQETIPIIITARKIRQGMRKINNSPFFIRRIDKRYFFGVDYIKQGEMYYPYSDIEKTFIDLVYYKQAIAKDTLASLKSRIDAHKMKKYIKKYPKPMQKRVLSVLSRS